MQLLCVCVHVCVGGEEDTKSPLLTEILSSVQ